MDPHHFSSPDSRLGWEYPEVAAASQSLQGAESSMAPVEEPSPNAQAEEQDESRDVISASSRKTNKRAKYGKLDWDVHKEELKKLYLDENKELAEIMQLMQERHGFEASQKLYKDKFGVWGLKKNLPVKHAHFMVEKANKRKRNEGKDTVFSYGGQVWSQERIQSRAGRAKKSREAIDVDGMDTPRSISYKTPTTVMDTPEARNESNSESDSDSVVETEHGGGKTRAAPMLAWRGHTRSDLLAMRNTAQVFLEEGRSLDAENLLLEAREGLSHVLGSTSEDTNRVGYQLAELYAKSGRMRESDQVIEDMTQTHIQALGYKDKRAQQHVLHCVELLNAWNRTEDALAFLNRSWELSQTDEAAEHDHSHDKQQTGALQKQKPTKGKPNSGKEPLQAVAQSVNAASNPAQIDFALAVAQSHSELKDKFAEMLLLQITQICEQRPFHLPIQTLRARSELLKLYIRKNTVNNNAAAFENSKNVFLQVWDCYDWDAEKFESITVMEAALQLAADIHKGGGFDLIAASIFRQVEQRATHLYGFEDERTIWILITVGLVYQRYAGWDAAREWFEQAFLGALANPSWGKGDGIVRSLQNAMDKKHFSYLSDEGRPFKTIFGVSGITIRPGRLHLE